MADISTRNTLSSPAATSTAPKPSTINNIRQLARAVAAMPLPFVALQIAN